MNIFKEREKNQQPQEQQQQPESFDRLTKNGLLHYNAITNLQIIDLNFHSMKWRRKESIGKR